MKELALLFLRLGTTAFGGPAAHIAMMEHEVVRRRQWISREEFLDLLGATNLIPGPNSTELAIHLGHRRAGFPGLLVAGACFIFPAFVIVSAIAWAYVKFGQLPELAGILYGVKPVIIAVVLQALWGLAKSAVKTRTLAVIGVLAIVATAVGVNELLVLLVAGAITCAFRAMQRPPELPKPNAVLLAPLGATVGVGAGAAAAGVAFTLPRLFLFFLKVGSVLFGSGYVLLAFLRADLVEHWHWLTEAQLLDAIAVGQVTPGPVFTTATFIGYLLAGFKGGTAATLGIFLPAFVFVALSGPLVPRMRRSRLVGAALDGVNVGSLALMAVVTFQLGKSALIDRWTLALALVSAALLLKWKLNSAWLVLGGALVGLAVHAMH